MRALIVLSHPEPRSFNGALKDVAEDALKSLGYCVETADLYAEGFDPVEKPDHYTNRKNPDCFGVAIEQRHASDTDALPRDVVRELSRLDRADLVVFQFPLWNHGVPAMLKGWFDRVFVSGGVYKSTRRHSRGYFRGKRAICSVTAGAGELAFGPYARGGDINWLMYPIHRELYYMGFSVLPPFLAYGVPAYGVGYKEESHFDQIEAEWASRLKNISQTEPIAFPRWDEWDQDGRLKDPEWPAKNRSRTLETSSGTRFEPASPEMCS